MAIWEWVLIAVPVYLVVVLVLAALVGVNSKNERRQDERMVVDEAERVIASHRR